MSTKDASQRRPALIVRKEENNNNNNKRFVFTAHRDAPMIASAVSDAECSLFTYMSTKDASQRRPALIVRKEENNNNNNKRGSFLQRAAMLP